MKSLMHRPSPRSIAGLVAGCVLAVTCAGDAFARKPPPDKDFKSDTPFSKVVKGGGDSVCWNVKRAFLSQGYIMERGSDSVILTGTKEQQKDKKTNITLRLQTTCVDNKDGTSTIFATAQRETSELQKVRQGVSAGVSFATVTVPTGSENVMQVVRRETVQDTKFYDGFYELVEGYVAGDKSAHAVEAGDKGQPAGEKGKASGDKESGARDAQASNERASRDNDSYAQAVHDRETRDRAAGRAQEPAADRVAHEDSPKAQSAGNDGTSSTDAGDDRSQ